MSIDAVAPLLSFLITPVDSQASYRSPWCLSETFAGFFTAGSDSGLTQAQIDMQGLSQGDVSAAQFRQQRAFRWTGGPLDFIRFLSDGTAAMGTQAALDAKATVEFSGFTVILNTEWLQNRIQGESVAHAPLSPANTPVLLWRAEQGEGWEAVLAARSPVVTSIRHRPAPSNRSVKLRTVEAWKESAGFSAVFEMHGIPKNHQGEPAIRLSWGDKYSLVFRGIGANARPQLQRRRQGAWEIVKTLHQAGPLDLKFWNQGHALWVQRCGERLILELDGQSYWFVETQEEEDGPKLVRAHWPKAPLRFSAVGAACNFQVNRLTGKDEQGKAIQASFHRSTPAPDRPLANSMVDFRLVGRKTGYANLTGGTRANILGSVLDRVKIEGRWADEVVDYDVTLVCSEIEAPVLSAFAINFPAPATAGPPQPVEVTAAVGEWSVDSGDPETLPDSSAHFTLSRALLDKLVPNWKTAILPYRPCQIRAKFQGEEEWRTLHRGYLTPETAVREGWDAEEIPIQVRGELLKVMEPYGLIDEHYSPLDLLLKNGKTRLYGAEAVQELLAIERGKDALLNFNGDGNPLRFFSSSHYPLLDPSNGGYFDKMLSTSFTSGQRLPPPYKSYLNTWIDSIAKLDFAVWFYDSADQAFYYGRLPEILGARGATVWDVSEIIPSHVKTSQEWPLLTSLSYSGLLEGAYNEVRFFGAPLPGYEAYKPSLVMGRAGDDNPDSLDPLSVAQSGRRSLVIESELNKLPQITTNDANNLARWVWRSFEGRPPKRLELQFDTGFLGPRWGELLHLPYGFEGPRNDGLPQDFRILQVKHKGSMASGASNRFETNITARSLSSSEQSVIW